MCVYWYFRPENYYSVHLAMRVAELQGKIKIFSQNNYCAHVENKPECFKAFMIANEDIKFNSDLSAYTIAVNTVCGDKNIYCTYEATNKLVASIKVEKLWLPENIKIPDDDYKLIFKKELTLMNNFLRGYRKKLSDQYSVESDPTKKTNLIEFVKQIDSKIVTLQSTEMN